VYLPETEEGTGTVLPDIQFLNSVHNSFQNTQIDYRTILTLRVMVVIEGRRFPKRKGVKKYLATFRAQERLNELFCPVKN
jgi:hypothetical protein